MNVFQTFPDTIYTPKEWFSSRKGPKEGERVARGHFHERVGETPVHWLSLSVGPIPKPFSVSENGPFEVCGGSNSNVNSKFHDLLNLIFHSPNYNGA